MYDEHTRAISTTSHRSLYGRSGKKALLETKALHTQNKTLKKHIRQTNIHESENKRFERMELPAKLLDYFLRSNEGNIN